MYIEFTKTTVMSKEKKVMENEKLYNKLCVPILDKIYFLQNEHRTLFLDLVDKGRCYLNRDMLGFNIMMNTLNEYEDTFLIEDFFEDDELFNSHRMILRASKPSMSNKNWIKVSLKK